MSHWLVVLSTREVGVKNGGRKKYETSQVGLTEYTENIYVPRERWDIRRLVWKENGRCERLHRCVQSNSGVLKMINRNLKNVIVFNPFEITWILQLYMWKCCKKIIYSKIKDLTSFIFFLIPTSKNFLWTLQNYVKFYRWDTKIFLGIRISLLIPWYWWYNNYYLSVYTVTHSYIVTFIFDLRSREVGDGCGPSLSKESVTETETPFPWHGSPLSTYFTGKEDVKRHVQKEQSITEYWEEPKVTKVI